MVHELFPYLCVTNAPAAIDFYVKVFGAREKFRLTEPSGRVGHAELDFNGTALMLADEFPEHGILGAQTIGATPVTIHLHVDNADDVIQKAVHGGAVIEMAPKDHFYGERSGSIRDPFGHRWSLAKQTKQPSRTELDSVAKSFGA